MAETMEIAFEAVVETRGINPFVVVTASVAAILKPEWRRAMPVLVRINGEPSDGWRINMMPAGNGSFYLYLHETVRKASGTAVGDRVTVKVSFDDAYRNGPQHCVPVWFEQALNRHLEAQNNWLALSPSRQKEILRYLSRLVTQEAKTRNLAKAMHVLSGNRARFMAREWKNGS
jgi:hypothetical protein